MGTPHIPAVKASLALDAVGDSCFTAPGSSVSAQNMKATHTTFACTYRQCVNRIQYQDKHTKPHTLLAIHAARPCILTLTKPDFRGG